MADTIGGASGEFREVIQVAHQPLTCDCIEQVGRNLAVEAVLTMQYLGAVYQIERLREGGFRVWECGLNGGRYEVYDQLKIAVIVSSELQMWIAHDARPGSL